MEDRLNRFGIRKMGKKRDGSIEETPGGCKCLFTLAIIFYLPLVVLPGKFSGLKA